LFLAHLATAYMIRGKTDASKQTMHIWRPSMTLLLPNSRTLKERKIMADAIKETLIESKIRTLESVQDFIAKEIATYKAMLQEDTEE
jgi:hypothetical protein